MNQKYLLGAAAAVLMSFAASAAPPDQPGHHSPAPGTSNDTMSAVKDTAGHVVGTVSAEATTSLKGFVDAAAVSDMYEIEAGKIAEQRSHNDGVKDFAAKMVTDHSKTSKKLASVLSENNINITPPARLDDRRQGMIDELRGAKEADFDNRYISQQVAAHKEAVILMRGYAKDGDNKPVAKLAGKTLPMIQGHLSMAEKLAKSQS